MHIFIVKTGEPLPTGGREVRLWRSGLLTKRLLELGHEVTWLSSTFEHGAKRHMADNDVVVKPVERLTIRAFWAPGYSQHRSWQRLFHHWVLTHKVDRWMTETQRPDVVVAALPVPELAACAIRHAREWGIPSIVDCRDMWPDNLLEGRTGLHRAFLQLATSSMRHATRDACRAASAVTGHTEEFVDWAVAQGGRIRTDLDRSFPLGYPVSPPSESALRHACETLDRVGIREGDATFRVTFVGTLTRHFDLRPMVDSARKAKQHGLRMQFVVCGDGDRLGPLRDAASGLGSVKWLGWQDAAVIWALLRRSHVGLAPYAPSAIFAKSIPNKVIEYLSAGLPVLSSLGGLTQQLLEMSRGGWTYGTEQGAGLWERLERLADDPETLGAASRAARKLFDDRFEARRVYDEFAGHIAQLVRPAC